MAIVWAKSGECKWWKKSYFSHKHRENIKFISTVQCHWMFIYTPVLSGELTLSQSWSGKDVGRVSPAERMLGTKAFTLKCNTHLLWDFCRPLWHGMGMGSQTVTYVQLRWKLSCPCWTTDTCVYQASFLISENFQSQNLQKHNLHLMLGIQGYKI